MALYNLYKNKDINQKDNKNTYETYQMNSKKRGFGFLYLAIALMIPLFFFGFLNRKEKTEVADIPNQVKVSIDYEEEIAVVTPGSGSSTKLYFSKDKMKTWELMDTSGVMDISALLGTKEVELYFKGNKDTNPLKVILQAPNSNLKVEYKVANGQGFVAVVNQSLPVEYRNGANGQWKTVNGLVYTALYEVNGATLQFRTKATKDVRSGKIVSLKVPKRPNAPSVKVDGSKMCITGLKYGEMEYRVGDSTTWIPFLPADKNVKTLDLKELFAKDYPANVPLPGGVVEVRTMATDKKVASSVKVLEVPAQAGPPTDVTLEGTTLTVLNSNKKVQYEYTKVGFNEVFDINKAKWSTVTGAKPVIIKGAYVGDKIYVRVKSTTDSTTKQIVPASLPREFTVEYSTVVKK